ncbi:MAG: hypothetical protein KJ592_04515 [Nanoarchaeota archaeon]|nr:hypothetical protein [Nanoarchaeota archaeon]
MKKVSIILLSLILISTLVLAANTENENAQTRIEATKEMKQELTTQIQERVQERKQLREETMENIREKMQEGQEIEMSEKRLVLTKINEEIMELKSERATVRTQLQLNNEGNLSELKTRLSNGRNAEIKIMPETASEKALTRLRLRNCNESQNCTIELKEVGTGDKTRAAYEVRARKTFRILGFIKNHEEISTQIDAETGEIIQTKRPWWSFLSSEQEE